MKISIISLNGRKHLPKYGKKNCLPLTPKQWKNAFDKETGRLLNGDKILQRIRQGGVEASIRAEVWPFLLNFYALESTQKEREEERLVRSQVYEDLKWRCKVVRESISSQRKMSSEDVMPCEGMEADRLAAFQRSKSGFVEMDAETKQEFINWQRIMRLDAVRINADWVQLSSSQANISKVVANHLAREVGLRDNILEPSLQHHAAIYMRYMILRLDTAKE